MAVPVLYFIRHGETDWNVEGRLQGQSDIPLNDVGRVQADQAGRKLRDIMARPEDLPWLVSPLARTRETAERARRAIGLPSVSYQIDDRLKELTFGAWEGHTWKELRRVDNAGVEARFADKWGYVPPDRAESYAMLRDRIAGWLEHVDRDSIVVSHGGVARVLFVILTGMNPDEAADAPIWQGKLIVFREGRADWV
ncbi:histidine phosphatase family protein [Labrys wisconsinensis]|uniref:histidine phosphatase family protein n=1 Tax=Labrys wisconsinensis TaxID=425677 RepID=UPI0027D7D34F|nr:histidine phosphatase family protein [Labrys wisconsinensis]